MNYVYTFICKVSKTDPVTFQLTLNATDYPEALKKVAKDFPFAIVVSLSSVREA